MAWPTVLVFVRHAESEGNIRSADERAGFAVSTHAYGLTERGKKQAEITGQYIKEKFGDFDAFYASYYRRSKDTMSLMFKEARIYEDPRLAEAQRGIWHTMTKEEIRNRFPEELARKEREGLYHYRPLGGENWPDVELRIHSFLGTLNRDYDGKRILIVAHGHWLILFQRLLHHFPIEEAVKRYEAGVFENASLTVYEGILKDGKSRLVLKDEGFVPWAKKI
ncbi:MAG: histidine phosphatase family protein [bacterium]|nr:histidine phosphatase family protein [bacterium]